MTRTDVGPPDRAHDAQFGPRVILPSQTTDLAELNR